MFQHSIDTCDEHHVTWYNMGICYYYLQIYDKSLECFSKCLNLSPDYHDAKYVALSFIPYLVPGRLALRLVS